MVLTAASCSPRSSGSLVSVVSRIPPRNLAPASRRQDHTTLPCALAPFVTGTTSVHRIPPRVDDVAQRPSVGRDGMDIGVIWLLQNRNIFAEGTGQPKSA